jgi:(1->4)-alpha-D-glucan 1-alpha-D-glucosylmutase
VGGEPDTFGQTVQAFHAHARFRAQRYPLNLLTTASHDHKRGEDTRMRLIALAETPRLWVQALRALDQIAEKHRSAHGPARPDEYLFYQTLVALREGSDPDALGDRLQVYMKKASRESKRQTSWLNPDEAYEAALDAFVDAMVTDEQSDIAIGELSRLLARYGFFNGLSQLVLKLTTPGVPDIDQGCELLDLSLVDPDNRRPVDYLRRAALLYDLKPLLAAPDPARLQAMAEARDVSAKLYMTARAPDRMRRVRRNGYSSGASVTAKTKHC